MSEIVDRVHETIENVTSGVAALAFMWLLIVSIATLALVTVAGVYSWKKASHCMKKPLVNLMVVLGVILGLIILFTLFSFFRELS